MGKQEGITYRETSMVNWILKHPLIDIVKLSDAADINLAELKFFIQKQTVIGMEKLDVLESILMDYGYSTKEVMYISSI